MNQNKPTVLLEYHLKQLKLPSMLREYPSLAAVCSKERTDYPTYLLRLSERELLDRERRAAERNEQLIANWKRTTWPRVKKTPAS